jgi:hypothetical protein
MREMIKHFPLPDSKSLREIFCSHFSFAEEGDHSLAKSLLLVRFPQNSKVLFSVNFPHFSIFPNAGLRPQPNVSKADRWGGFFSAP